MERLALFALFLGLASVQWARADSDFEHVFGTALRAGAVPVLAAGGASRPEQSGIGFISTRSGKPEGLTTTLGPVDDDGFPSRGGLPAD